MNNRFVVPVFFGPHTVAQLTGALAAQFPNSTVFCSDAVWSGGVGCLAISNGTSWLNPEGVPVNVGNGRVRNRISVEADGRGDFTTIAAAIAYINSLTGGDIPTSSYPYLIEVGIGTFIESFTLPDYVNLNGASYARTRIAGVITFSRSFISNASITPTTSVASPLVWNLASGSGYASGLLNLLVQNVVAGNIEMSAILNTSTIAGALYVQNSTFYVNNSNVGGSASIAVFKNGPSAIGFWEFRGGNHAKSSIGSGGLQGSSYLFRNYNSGLVFTTGFTAVGGMMWSITHDLSPKFLSNASSDNGTFRISGGIDYTSDNNSNTLVSPTYTGGYQIEGVMNRFAAPVFLSTYTVAQLTGALAILYPNAIADCTDGVWSGGTGCLVRSDGTNWIDPDGHKVGTSLYNEAQTLTPRNTGVIFPLYRSIADSYTDPGFLTLLDQIRSRPSIPFIVIANTASSGPGSSYVSTVGVAITSVKGTGAEVVGYVDTNYGAKTESAVMAEVDMWRTLYTHIDGIFFDRTGYAVGDTTTPLKQTKRDYYKSIRQKTELRNFTPLVFNSGSPLLSEWYEIGGDNVFGDSIVVIAESASQPSEADMKGFNNTHLFVPVKRRAMLLHSQASLPDFTLAKKYYGWIGVSDDAIFQSTVPYYASFLTSLLDSSSSGGGAFAATVITAVPSPDQANWAPGTIDGYTIIRANPTDNAFISGVAGGASGDILVIKNVSAGMVWLIDEDATSTAANRFEIAQHAMILMPDDAATFIYDSTATRWVEVAVDRNVLAPDDTGIVILPNTTTSVVSIGQGATSNTATLSTVEPTATPSNLFLAEAYTQITNATASGSSNVRGNVLRFMRGATTNRQGIFYYTQFRNPALGATGGVFAGMTNSTAAITTQPRATNNSFGLGTHGGETTHRVYSRDGTAATAVDLGANFPANSATAAYAVAFLAMPNTASIKYMVLRLDTRFTAQGTISANLPANTLGLAPRVGTMVGATATASTMQFNRIVCKRIK